MSLILCCFASSSTIALPMIASFHLSSGSAIAFLTPSLHESHGERGSVTRQSGNGSELERRITFLWNQSSFSSTGAPEAIRIELDPGLAFGTGTHPTTALCLEWLDSRDIAGRQVVDYGCGSGILGIAAAKLGAGSVLAMDIDPQALIATRENAERNGVSDRIAVTGDPQLAAGSADVLLANILAGPLVELAPRFAAALVPGGRLALSGLLPEQADAVTGAYRPWFHIETTTTRDGWVLLGARRQTN